MFRDDLVLGDAGGAGRLQRAAVVEDEELGDLAASVILLVEQQMAALAGTAVARPATTSTGP
jgi:hypothetical protein